MLYILVGAAAIGGIIGGIIGLVLSRKTILTLDEMIQEIEETSELDEGKEETKK
jgi:ABC-type lipoprotein release transport system permease subunit